VHARSLRRTTPMALFGTPVLSGVRGCFEADTRRRIEASEAPGRARTPRSPATRARPLGGRHRMSDRSQPGSAWRAPPKVTTFFLRAAYEASAAARAGVTPSSIRRSPSFLCSSVSLRHVARFPFA
jgi:hypothetical protein